jgi:hypothetical protein
MITKTWTVKIADFGLAKSLDATKKLTQTNMYMGTVAYTSPEQGEGKPLDNRTDIYSLGIVLYQLLTGSVPFKAETPSSVIYKHVYEAPPPPRTINPGLSPQIEAVVLKAIAKKPEDRFQNVVDFRAALEAVNETQPDKKGGAPKQAAVFAGQGTASSPTGVAAATKSRSNVPFLIAFVVIILLLGGSALYAAKYGGYRALFSKVFPSATQEDTKSEAIPQPAGEVAIPPAREVGVSRPEPSGPAGGNAPRSREMASIPPAGSAKKEKGMATEDSGLQSTPPENRTAPIDQPRSSKRAMMPAVLVVTSGEPHISDIVESVIGKKLQERSFPISATGEIQALSDRYGRHGIPLNVLDQRQLKADVLVYVSVSTMNAGPLRFYGQSMEQYASTISIKVIDTATRKVIGSPRTKTVNYTTLNMQDNIEEAAEEIVSDLPKRLITFWKG